MLPACKTTGGGFVSAQKYPAMQCARSRCSVKRAAMQQTPDILKSPAVLPALTATPPKQSNYAHTQRADDKFVPVSGVAAAVRGPGWLHLLEGQFAARMLPQPVVAAEQRLELPLLTQQALPRMVPPHQAEPAACRPAGSAPYVSQCFAAHFCCQ